jgi:tripartite-type tricarboxylate transporter receptor subunit TctC
MRWRLWGLALLAATTSLDPTHAGAQPYPTRPIRWIVPFPAAGPADIAARLVGERLADALGQPVFIDNRAGASGVIGTELGVKAPPDGYTLVTGIASSITTNQLFLKMDYDPARDLAPVSLLTRGYLLLVVRPDLPAASLTDFIALARAQPGKLSYGSWGNGSATHLAMALLGRRADLELTHIPYKGSAPVLSDLMAGQIDVTFETTNPALNYVRAGRLRALAVSAARRAAALPELPAIAEAFPGFAVATWGAVFAPLGTPAAIIDLLSREIARIMKDPAVQARFIDLGSEPVGGTPEELAQTVRQDVALWRQVVKDAGITAE